MKFCTDHWTALREAIDKRGLTAWIAESGEQATRNLLSEQTEGRTIDNFDPLMAAHNAIMANTLWIVDPPARRLLTTDECPICYCNREDPANAGGSRVHDYDVWIDKAADDALKVWQELGSS